MCNKCDVNLMFDVTHKCFISLESLGSPLNEEKTLDSLGGSIVLLSPSKHDRG